MFGKCVCGYAFSITAFRKSRKDNSSGQFNLLVAENIERAFNRAEDNIKILS